MARAKCPNCATETNSDSAFCQACGAPLAVPATARGLPGGPPRRAERRPLTVLFCDIVGSVSLANTLDPEDMMHVLEVFRTSCDDIIAHHGGYVAKYMGDGVLAYFGYPSADEEDASHAVRAALALQRAMGSLPLPDGITCQARIGVATGLVVISDLVSRGEVREVGVVGETPNLAARLQGAAPAGRRNRRRGDAADYRRTVHLPTAGAIDAEGVRHSGAGLRGARCDRVRQPLPGAGRKRAHAHLRPGS